MKLKWIFCKSKDILKLSDAELDRAVKIKGTQYDRKRKVTDKQIEGMRNLYKQGKSISSIADTYSVSIMCVKEHVDPEFYNRELERKRKWAIENSAKLKRLTRQQAMEAIVERASYKRNLVGTNKIIVHK